LPIAPRAPRQARRRNRKCVGGARTTKKSADASIRLLERLDDVAISTELAVVLSRRLDNLEPLTRARVPGHRRSR
jgi:hypothetical protein